MITKDAIMAQIRENQGLMGSIAHSLPTYKNLEQKNVELNNQLNKINEEATSKTTSRVLSG